MKANFDIHWIYPLNSDAPVKSGDYSVSVSAPTTEQMEAIARLEARKHAAATCNTSQWAIGITSVYVHGIQP